jgi:hypothetical protein
MQQRFNARHIPFANEGQEGEGRTPYAMRMGRAVEGWRRRKTKAREKKKRTEVQSEFFSTKPSIYHPPKPDTGLRRIQWHSIVSSFLSCTKRLKPLLPSDQDKLRATVAISLLLLPNGRGDLKSASLFSHVA